MHLKQTRINVKMSLLIFISWALK